MKVRADDIREAGKLILANCGDRDGVRSVGKLLLDKADSLASLLSKFGALL